ncbi:MAG: hypothetical protein GQ474_10565 [Sulfurimonas sp.]|nr:hypothetical protein [Sulfurimonas sp.]
MRANKYYQSVRDEVVEGGEVFELTSSVAETLNASTVAYPFIVSQDSTSLDTVMADNVQLLWKQVNKLAKRLGSKLNDTVQTDGERFVMHFGFKMNGIGAKESHKYIPFTLNLDDGQVLTALARNTSNTKSFNPKKELLVTHWYLNKQDVTKAIYKQGDTNIDDAVLVTKLAIIIEKVHTRFVANNPQIKISSKTALSLRSEIDAMDIDLSDVVEADKTYAEWEGEITAGLETKLNITTSDAQGIVEAQNFLLKQSWAKGDSSKEVVEKLTEKSPKEIQAEKVNEWADDLSNKIVVETSLEFMKEALDKDTFSVQQTGSQSVDVKNYVTGKTMKFSTLETATKEEVREVVEMIKAEKVEEKKTNTLSKVEEFIEKHFSDTINSKDKSILKKFLEDTSMENPQIGNPSTFGAGLKKAGVMEDNDTFMTGFSNLRDMFYGIKVGENSEVLEKTTYTISLPKGTEKYLTAIKNSFKLDEALENITYKFVIDGVSMDEIGKKSITIDGGEKSIQTKIKQTIHLISIGADKIEGKNSRMPSVALLRNAEYIKEKTGLDYVIEHEQHATFRTDKQEFSSGDDGRGHNLYLAKGKHERNSVKERWLMSNMSRKKMIEYIIEELEKERTSKAEEPKDMDTFKEELEFFETDDFVTVGEFAEAYKEELSQYTEVDLKDGATYQEQALAIEDAQRALFGDKKDIETPKEQEVETTELSDQEKLAVIKKFIGKAQYSILKNAIKDEEHEFKEVLTRLHKTITGMPKMYATDGSGDKAMAQLHYFKGSSDWYITEVNQKDPSDAFGYVVLNGDSQMSEIGNVSIDELTRLDVELDFYFTPITVGEAKTKAKGEEVSDQRFASNAYSETDEEFLDDQKFAYNRGYSETSQPSATSDKEVNELLNKYRHTNEQPLILKAYDEGHKDKMEEIEKELKEEALAEKVKKETEPEELERYIRETKKDIKEGEELGENVNGLYKVQSELEAKREKEPSYQPNTDEFLGLSIDDLDRAMEIMEELTVEIEKDSENESLKEAYEAMNKHLDGMVG